MATTLLYLTNSESHYATARVIASGEDGGKPWVSLDRTIFHVRGGGQPPDVGTISGIRTLDVRRHELEVRHFLERPLPVGVAEVEMNVDAAIRTLHSRWHTAGHLVAGVLEPMLSVEFSKANQAPGEGWIAAEASPHVPEHIVDRCNSALAEVIARDLVVCVAPDALRIVTISGMRPTPCGGTHVRSLAMIGSARVTKISSKKGGTRASFEVTL